MPTGVIEMIQGAAQELVVGDTADLATDVGPVIDREAFDGIQKHLQRLNSESKCLLPSVEGSSVRYEFDTPFSL